MYTYEFILEFHSKCFTVKIDRKSHIAAFSAPFNLLIYYWWCTVHVKKHPTLKGIGVKMCHTSTNRKFCGVAKSLTRACMDNYQERLLMMMQCDGNWQ